MASDPASELPPGRARIAAAVDAGLDKMVAAAVEAIWTQVPAYGDSTDPRLRDDVTAHVAAVFQVFLAELASDRPTRRADFPVTREQAGRRRAQGIALADFLRAFHIGQLTLWRNILDVVRDDAEARDAALGLVARLMHLIEVGSTVAGEAYVEAQQHQVAEIDRVYRDVVEDLLAGRTTFAGRKRSILQAAGLGADSRLLVASACPVDETSEYQALSAAAAAIAGRRRGGASAGPGAGRGGPGSAGEAAVGGGGGLATLRQDEVVGVLPLPRGGARAAVAGLERACAELSSAPGTSQDQRIRLAVGVSTIHSGLHEVPEAYAEARVARDALGTSDGVLALPLLTAFDYLVLREGQTAQRLIRPEVRRFVADDAAAGGALIATLVEYAACDLNAKVAAKRLHLHVNTAYYRLERIAERTGCDLRSLADVVELLIAARLFGAVPAGVIRGPAS